MQIEVEDLKDELAEMKEVLARGGQRKLSKILKCHPNRVSNAFDGFVSDEEFLLRLRNETQKLLKKQKAVNK